MNKYIDLNKSEFKELSFLSDSEFKEEFERGWGYPNVYYFKEIRDIFIALKNSEFKSLKEFTELCTFDLKIGFEKTPWKERRILEQVNALIKFELVNGEDKTVLNDKVFLGSQIGGPLSVNDLKDFKEIFFSYHRFRELMTWFLDPEITDSLENVSEESLKEESKVIYSFMRENRFYDSFLFKLEKNAPIYIIKNTIQQNNEHVMRFWEVFIKWGRELSLINKFNMKGFEYELSIPNKSFSCIYFTKQMPSDFDLIRYIDTNYKDSYISIKELMFDLIRKFRYSIPDLHNELISVSKTNFDEISLQRTSETFLQGSDSLLLPKVDGSYVSHILKY